MNSKTLLTLITVISICFTIFFGVNYFLHRVKTVSYKTPKTIYIDEFGNETDVPPKIEEDMPAEVTYITTGISSSSKKQKKTTTNTITTQNIPTMVEQLTADDRTLITLSDEAAWSLLTNGKFSKYPTVPFGTIKSQFADIYKENQTTITVPIWYWENPKDENNFNKVTKLKQWVVNKHIASLCEHVFNDIYNDPSQPIINIADSGMGTWSVRGKMHSDARTVSAHALGASFDINPSTGSFNIDGVTYGNAYGNQPMPAEVWEELPESHKKYNVLYVDCPIVRIFKSYGFYWGGDWSSSKDVMHLAFLGDGNNAREIGKQNYVRYTK